MICYEFSNVERKVLFYIYMKELSKSNCYFTRAPFLPVFHLVFNFYLNFNLFTFPPTMDRLEYLRVEVTRRKIWISKILKLVRFFPPVFLINLRSSIVVDDVDRDLLLCDGYFRASREFAFRCFDRHIAVHVRVLLHVVASLPRFSRRFSVVTNERELPFLLW